MQTYEIATENVTCAVEVRAGDAILAQSTRAVVMRETVVGDVIYLPKADVRQDLLVPSTLKTFCPFKGTASYWSAALPGRVLENVAWSYEKPLPEAEPIHGYLGFDAAQVDIHYPDQLSDPTDAQDSGEQDFTFWVLQQSFFAPPPAEFCRLLAERLVADGVPIVRLNVALWTLHPEILGQSFTWWRDEPEMSVMDIPIDILDEDRYKNSPTFYVSAGLGGVRQRLDDPNPEFDFPVMDDLREKGCTDYVAMPIMFSDGSNHVLTLASDDPNGFTTDQLGRVFMHSGVIARIFETHAQRRTTASLLQTYLGKRSADRVLAGASHRGDGETIEAAVLFCDLRNSSGLAQNYQRGDLLAVLNRFFEQTVCEIEAEGGEVLKFIGDAVLAIFPVEDGTSKSALDDNGKRACLAAYQAAKNIQDALGRIETPDGEAIRSVVGLNFGAVKYGNVGAPSRLDFTVSGAAVHMTERLQELCKNLDEQILLSDDFAQRLDHVDLKDLGDHALRGFKDPINVRAPL